VGANVVELCDFFFTNKEIAERICERDKARIPKAMRMTARDKHLELGIVYPKDHLRSNEFTPIDYNQGDVEFRAAANNACEYYYRKARRL
jgi:hypothetical protein